jgi:hypothetical protein
MWAKGFRLAVVTQFDSQTGESFEANCKSDLPKLKSVQVAHLL